MQLFGRILSRVKLSSALRRKASLSLHLGTWDNWIFYESERKKGAWVGKKQLFLAETINGSLCHLDTIDQKLAIEWILPFVDTGKVGHLPSQGRRIPLLSTQLHKRLFNNNIIKEKTCSKKSFSFRSKILGQKPSRKYQSLNVQLRPLNRESD